ncbi:MAG: NifU N-terminal domain-containing protein [Gemmatimonadetes bacterium]|nr:NifU N-terminal domain-containing protein [Gemmatimonadota bacterium]
MARAKAAKVKFDPTPNPNAGKFTVGRTLVEGRHGLTFDTAEAASANPVAAALLALEGVRSVFMVADFVTVTKDAGASWADLAPLAQQAIRAAL